MMSNAVYTQGGWREKKKNRMFSSSLSLDPEGSNLVEQEREREREVVVKKAPLRTHTPPHPTPPHPVSPTDRPGRCRSPRRIRPTVLMCVNTCPPLLPCLTFSLLRQEGRLLTRQLGGLGIKAFSFLSLFLLLLLLLKIAQLQPHPDEFCCRCCCCCCCCCCCSRLKTFQMLFCVCVASSCLDIPPLPSPPLHHHHHPLSVGERRGVSGAFTSDQAQVQMDK